jgi:DNA polymerase-3 subunit gamma/tau
LLALPVLGGKAKGNRNPEKMNNSKVEQQSTYQPWHLEFRPKTLEDLSGHELVKRTLINSINQGKIANGYLLCGGKGTGKTSTARIFAKSLNCLKTKVPTVKPCGECSNCKEIELGNNLDVIEIDAASNNGVEHVRGIIETAQLSAMNSRYRVYILDEAHMLTRAASNSLLKSLEEASKKKLVFILATTEKEKVIDTIASRCQTFDFLPIPQSAIVKRLEFICKRENVEASAEAIEAIAKHCQGGMRDAIQKLEKLVLCGRTPLRSEDVRQEWCKPSTETLKKVINCIFSGEPSEVYELLKAGSKLINEGKQPKIIIQDMLEIYRDLMLLVLMKKGGEKRSEVQLRSDLGIEYLQEITAKTCWEEIDVGIRILAKAEEEITNSHGGVWIDILLMRIARYGMF